MASAQSTPRRHMDGSGTKVLEAVANNPQAADELMSRLDVETARHQQEILVLAAEKEALAKYLAGTYQRKSASRTVGLATPESSFISHDSNLHGAALRTAVTVDTSQRRHGHGVFAGMQPAPPQQVLNHADPLRRDSSALPHVMHRGEPGSGQHGLVTPVRAVPPIVHRAQSTGERDGSPPRAEAIAEPTWVRALLSCVGRLESRLDRLEAGSTLPKGGPDSSSYGGSQESTPIRGRAPIPLHSQAPSVPGTASSSRARSVIAQASAITGLGAGTDVDRAVAELWNLIQLRQDAMLATLAERLDGTVKALVRDSLREVRRSVDDITVLKSAGEAREEIGEMHDQLGALTRAVVELRSSMSAATQPLSPVPAGHADDSPTLQLVLSAVGEVREEVRAIASALGKAVSAIPEPPLVKTIRSMETAITGPLLERVQAIESHMQSVRDGQEAASAQAVQAQAQGDALSAAMSGTAGNIDDIERAVYEAVAQLKELSQPGGRLDVLQGTAQETAALVKAGAGNIDDVERVAQETLAAVMELDGRGMRQLMQLTCVDTITAVQECVKEGHEAVVRRVEVVQNACNEIVATGMENKGNLRDIERAGLEVVTIVRELQADTTARLIALQNTAVESLASSAEQSSALSAKLAGITDISVESLASMKEMSASLVHTHDAVVESAALCREVQDELAGVEKVLCNVMAGVQVLDTAVHAHAGSQREHAETQQEHAAAHAQLVAQLQSQFESYHDSLSTHAESVKAIHDRFDDNKNSAGDHAALVADLHNKLDAHWDTHAERHAELVRELHVKLDAGVKASSDEEHAQHLRVAEAEFDVQRDEGHDNLVQRLQNAASAAASSNTEQLHGDTSTVDTLKARYSHAVGPSSQAEHDELLAAIRMKFDMHEATGSMLEKTAAIAAATHEQLTSSVRQSHAELLQLVREQFDKHSMDLSKHQEDLLAGTTAAAEHMAASAVSIHGVLANASAVTSVKSYVPALTVDFTVVTDRIELISADLTHITASIANLSSQFDLSGVISKIDALAGQLREVDRVSLGDICSRTHEILSVVETKSQAAPALASDAEGSVHVVTAESTRALTGAVVDVQECVTAKVAALSQQLAEVEQRIMAQSSAANETSAFFAARVDQHFEAARREVQNGAGTVSCTLSHMQTSLTAGMTEAVALGRAAGAQLSAVQESCVQAIGPLAQAAKGAQDATEGIQGLRATLSDVATQLSAHGESIGSAFEEVKESMFEAVSLGQSNAGNVRIVEDALYEVMATVKEVDAAVNAHANAQPEHAAAHAELVRRMAARYNKHGALPLPHTDHVDGSAGGSRTSLEAVLLAFTERQERHNKNSSAGIATVATIVTELSARIIELAKRSRDLKGALETSMAGSVRSSRANSPSLAGIGLTEGSLGASVMSHALDISADGHGPQQGHTAHAQAGGHSTLPPTGKLRL